MGVIYQYDQQYTSPTNVLDFYPVGSYYETSNSSFNPNNTWGGTWTSETISEDEIVEEGTDGIWTYRKWASGIAECWGQKTETNKSTTAWGSWYYVQILEVAYPQGLFTSMVHVSGTVRWEKGSLISNVEATGSTTTAPKITGVRPNNISGTGNAAGTWHAIGRWKATTTPTTLYKWYRTA